MFFPHFCVFLSPNCENRKTEVKKALCLPFDLASFSGTPLDGAIVMTLQSSSFDTSSGTLFLYFEPVTAIEAGKPYIVKWTLPDKEIKNPVFLDVTISSPVKNIKTDAVTFCGVFDPFLMKANDRTKLYLGDSNTLYYPSKEMTINAFRAYFQLADGITAGDPSTGSGVRAFVLNFGNEETGIDSLIAAPSPTGEGSDYYTLDGRRLNSKPTQRGIYINNKRIIIIK